MSLEVVRNPDALPGWEEQDLLALAASQPQPLWTWTLASDVTETALTAVDIAGNPDKYLPQRLPHSTARSSFDIHRAQKITDALDWDDPWNWIRANVISARAWDCGASTGYVYLIHAPQPRLVKIGWSVDPEERLKGLQGSSPVALILVGKMFTTNSSETQMHYHFADQRVRGEWFREEVIAEIFANLPFKQLEDSLDSVLNNSHGCPQCGQRLPKGERSWEA